MGLPHEQSTLPLARQLSMTNSEMKESCPQQTSRGSSGPLVVRIACQRMFGMLTDTIELNENSLRLEMVRSFKQGIQRGWFRTVETTTKRQRDSQAVSTADRSEEPRRSKRLRTEH